MQRIVVSFMVVAIGVVLAACSTVATAPRSAPAPAADVAGAAGAAGTPAAAGAVAKLAPGTTFRDCADCPSMIVVPPGEFAMGRDAGEPERYEGPVRRVRIGYAFAAGRYEVTNAQYRRFVEASGHAPSGEGCQVPVPGGRALTALPGTSWADPGYGRPIRDDEPAACLRWSDAKSYVAWLAGVTGQRYRLLTEAEWEYAARAGTTGTFTWGDEVAQACRQANIFDRSAERGGVKVAYPPADCDDGFPGPAPVGSLAPNGFGLHDMIGNVWEWVEDCYEMPYGAEPVDGAAQLTRGCNRRGSRGGGWRSVYSRQIPTFRGRDPESLTSQIFGFRVARDLSP